MSKSNKFSRAKLHLEAMREANKSFPEQVRSGIVSNQYYKDWSGILPFVYQESGRFQVKVTPEEHVDFVTSFFQVRGRDNDSPEKSISDFFRETAKSLVMDEAAVYRIEELEDDGGLGLRYVSPEEVTLLEDHVIQVMPETLDEPSKIEKLPRSKFFICHPPSSIERGKGFRLTLRSLIDLSERRWKPMDFFEKEAHGSKTHFDYSLFRQLEEVSAFQETEGSGWHVGTLYSNRITEFYYTHRILRFRRSQAQLRNHILRVSNQVLRDARTHGVPEVQFEIQGLPSIEDIDQLILDLEAGKIGFLEAYHKVYP